MTAPQNTKVNVEDKWYGPESMGRYQGEPAIFLYYGYEGVSSNYTVDSLRRELDGWNWTDRISNHGTHLVFTSPLEEGKRDADPLRNTSSEEILDILKVQRHGKVRVHTPAYTLPGDEIDDSVDHYTVRIGEGRFRNKVDNYDDNIEWYANQSRRYDRVDFAFGFDGLKKNREYLQEFSQMYSVPDERIWVYAEDDEDYDGLINAVKTTGHRVCLRPEYFREMENG